MLCNCPGSAAKGIRHVDGCDGYLPRSQPQFITRADVDAMLSPLIARLNALESKPKRGRPRANTGVVEE